MNFGFWQGSAECGATMGSRLRKTVVLVGMMGAGKTAVGKALAARLGVPFRDSDAELQDAANMTIAEIFTRYGEPFFREKESQVIKRLLDSADKAILSTGGGAFLSAGNREMISQRGVSVCLKADFDLLWNRVKHKKTRPLLRTDDPKKTLGEIFDARAPIYALADVVVETKPDYTIEQTASRVLEALAAHGGVLEEE